jgi:hypothetical protein
MSKLDLLFRQIHPAHVKNGLSSGAFRPTPMDEDQLSVDCGNLTTAEAAFELHKLKTKINSSGDVEFLETAGTWAFDRADCAAEGLAVNPDPIEAVVNQPDNLAHHLVDFSSIAGASKKKNDAVSKRLRRQAEQHGRIWPNS